MLAHRTAFSEPINPLAYVVPQQVNYTISLRIFVGLFFMPAYRK